MAIPKERRSKPVTVPQSKMCVPRNPPISAPAIPRSMVARHPPGSFPGRRYFAIPPAIRPKMIQERTPIA